MKKLCVLLLALLIAVPALAMAEKVPTIDWDKIKTDPAYMFDLNNDVIVYKAGPEDGITYKFRYHFNGVLRDCLCEFSGGYAVYSPSGELSEYVGSIPSGIKEFETVSNQNTVLAPESLLDVLAEKGYKNLNGMEELAFPANQISISGNTISVNSTVNWIAAGRSSECRILSQSGDDYVVDGEKKYILVNQNGVTSVFSNTDGKLVLTKIYVDSLSYYPKNGYTHMRGDKKYTDARYDESSSREHYFLYSSDLKVKTAYDNKNRLQSHETWTADKAYWVYELDKEEDRYMWKKAADGKPAHAKAAEPTEEVLKSLILTDMKAEYDVGEPMNSLSDWDFDLEGLPFIVGADAGIKDAEIGVESQMVNQTTTTFNVTPTAGDKAVQPSSGVTLYLPLPAGMDKATAKKFPITIEHNNEVFSTVDNTAEVTEYGLKMKVTHFSPYTVIWGDEAVEAYNAGQNAQTLPKTGDDSQMMIYLALLAVSGALLLYKKRTA